MAKSKQNNKNQDKEKKSRENKKNTQVFLKKLEKKLKSKQSKNNKRISFPDNASKNQSNPNSNNQGPNPVQPSKNQRFVFSFLIILSVFLVFTLLTRPKENKDETVPYSIFREYVQEKKIKECTIIENENIIEFFFNDVIYTTRIPYTDLTLIEFLLDNKIVIKSESREANKYLLILLQWLPWIAITLLFWFFLMRQIKGRGGSAFNFSKSKAKLINRFDIKEDFNDVQGCNEAKEDLKDIVSFLKNPQKYIAMGAKIPKGVLLVGPPGTGKTLLAKAVAGEARVPFFSMSGSDFVELFVGVGASRVRDLFETGRAHAPCIIFIDELDAVGRARGAGYGGGHDEREQTLNQMLVEMDGFNTEKGIILIGATNRADILDRALLRPGRFDRQVVVDIPDIKGRKAILEIHAKKIKLAKNLSLDDCARSTPGFTGADLANLINEAAIIAVNDHSKVVQTEHIEKAKDKLMLGSERKSILINEEEKKNTAYHEAGHALVSMLVKTNTNPLHKISIIPRGRALGVTHFLPEDGKYTKKKSSIETEIRILYGGRVAEEVIFKDVTNGAVNDIERATRLARAMVCEWGLSDLGPISFGEKNQPVFIGKEINQSEAYSNETSKEIDREIKRILNEAYKDVLILLKKNIDRLKKLANKLLERETMEVTEVYKLLGLKMPKKLEIKLS